jgi:hypothetical protein
VTHDELVSFAAHVLGRRYACDFRVVSIGPGAQATLELHGDRFVLSLEELNTVISRGLVTEVPEFATHRKGH